MDFDAVNKRRLLRSLNGLDGEKHQVFSETDFFLNEWLGIADACEQAIVTRCSEGALADVVLADEDGITSRLRCVLRSIGCQSLVALFNMRRNVYDE